MEFVQHFIAEVSAGEKSLDVAAGKAYSRSLRRFHGWIVRGVFNVSQGGRVTGDLRNQLRYDHVPNPLVIQQTQQDVI